MTTATIIMAICLIILMAAAVFIIIRYARLSSDVEKRMSILEANEKAVQVRSNALDQWAHQLDDQARLIKNCQHVYATVAVDDPDDTAPEFPDTATYKKMKSQMGYYVVPKFREHIVRVHKDGKTAYTLDLYVSPFREKETAKSGN